MGLILWDPGDFQVDPLPWWGPAPGLAGCSWRGRGSVLHV